MGDVNFYLKSAEKKSGKSLIYLKYKFNGHVLVFAFGQTINPENWNKAKQRVKSNKETTADGKHSLNDLLDNLKRVCVKAYNEALQTGTPTPEQLRIHLQDFLNKNHQEEKVAAGIPTIFRLAERFIAGEIKFKGKDKSKSSLQNYAAVTKHLKEFQNKIKYQVNFESINLDFFYKYVTYLNGIAKLAPNSIAKDIAILKVFMGEAVDLGYTNNMQFKHKKFAYNEVDTDQVYLTEKEIIDLYRFDLSHNKKLEQVKDMFVFGAWVGLRFSDFSNIKPENIVQIDGEYFIKMITKKTTELVIIPCNPVVLDIFKKYNHNTNKLPKAISNQKFNDYIKVVCRMASEAENSPIKSLAEVGRLSTKPKMKLWECVASHTARRSMATNYYLQGFPTIDLMKITGHKTERAFLKYIRVSKLDTAKRLSIHIKKNWSEKMLKIAV